MATYTVQRIDVSSCTFEADSPEEALELSNEAPDQWEISIGTPEVFLDDN